MLPSKSSVSSPPENLGPEPTRAAKLPASSPAPFDCSTMHSFPYPTEDGPPEADHITAFNATTETSCVKPEPIVLFRMRASAAGKACVPKRAYPNAPGTTADFLTLDPSDPQQCIASTTRIWTPEGVAPQIGTAWRVGFHPDPIRTRSNAGDAVERAPPAAETGPGAFPARALPCLCLRPSSPSRLCRTIGSPRVTCGRFSIIRSTSSWAILRAGPRRRCQ